MKIKQVIPRDFSVVTVFNMGARALQLVVTAALVRILSVEDYASYTVFHNLVDYFRDCWAKHRACLRSVQYREDD